MASDPNAIPTPAGPDGPVEGTFLDLERFPHDAIVSGGPAKDGIPALTNPNFVGPSFVEYLRPDELVLGVVINGEARPIRTTSAGGTRSSTTKSAAARSR